MLDSIIFGLIVVLLLAKSAWRDYHWREAMMARDRRYDELQSHLLEAWKEVSQVLARNTATLLMHDAQVRGKNPEAYGSHEELAERILKGEPDAPRAVNRG